MPDLSNEAREDAFNKLFELRRWRGSGESDDQIAVRLGFASTKEMYNSFKSWGWPDWAVYKEYSEPAAATTSTGSVSEDRFSSLGCVGLPESEWNERTELYAGGVHGTRYQYFPSLALAWMEELARVGLSSDGRKTAGQVGYPPDYGGGGDVRPVRLDNGETINVRFAAYRNERGHLQIEVQDTPPRTDRAILAALSVLEGEDADMKKIIRALRALYGMLGGAEERLLGYADALLNHYRPEIWELPGGEQTELRVKACEYVNEVAKNSRRLLQFLEFGSPRKQTSSAAKKDWEDIRAAELHDIEGWSYLEIGEHLRLKRTKADEVRRDNKAARAKAERGRKYANQALGGKWDEYVATACQASRPPEDPQQSY